MSKKPNLRIDTTAAGPAFNVTASGTFTEADVAIGKRGLLVGGESPRVNPKHPPNLSTDPNEMRHQFQEVKLSDFKVLEPLGQGTSGRVDKVEYQGYVFALKVITLDLSQEARKQILLELKTAHRMIHRNIVSFFDAFYLEGNIYMALEYMDGGSLQDVLATVSTIPEDVLAHWARQILRAMAFLHKNHLIHRDLKPANILLNSAGRVKLADFGVSSQLDHTLSQANTYVGTVTYMSPERITGDKYGYDSDVWSFGLVCYELATGRFPYPPDDEEDKDPSFWVVLDFIVHSPPPVLPSIFSNELQDFVRICLTKERNARPSLSVLYKHLFVTKPTEIDLQEWTRHYLQKKEVLKAQETARFERNIEKAKLRDQQLQREREEELAVANLKDRIAERRSLESTSSEEDGKHS